MFVRCVLKHISTDMHATPFHMFLGNTGLLTIENVLYKVKFLYYPMGIITYLEYHNVCKP